MPNIILLCCQIVSNTAIDMQKLLSLPPNLVSAFYELENVDRTEWFCTSDPVGMKLGSGGGTTWLLREWQKERDRKYLAEERIHDSASSLLHASMELQTEVDPSIEGGFIFDINDFRLDASIATQLKKVKQQFIDKNRRIV